MKEEQFGKKKEYKWPRIVVMVTGKPKLRINLDCWRMLKIIAYTCLNMCRIKKEEKNISKLSPQWRWQKSKKGQHLDPRALTRACSTKQLFRAELIVLWNTNMLAAWLNFHILSLRKSGDKGSAKCLVEGKCYAYFKKEKNNCRPAIFKTEWLWTETHLIQINY